jgi:F-box protein 11
MRLMQEQATNTAAEEIELSQTPLAFLSYVNLDDKRANGNITEFRERLSHEVSLLIGEAFDIFQDKKDIALGQPWEERINDSLDATTFLIPIITPAFFKSDACRKELERFLLREKKLGRGDLILPVYYANCPILEDEEKRQHDQLAKVIAARHYTDWRELRSEEFTSSHVRKDITKIAKRIVAALELSEAESARAEAVRQAGKQPEKESKGAASQSNTFQSGGGPQSAALGNNPIGTQINNYYVQPPQDTKPQPASIAKTEPLTVIVEQHNRGHFKTIAKAIQAVKSGSRILVRPGVYKENIVIDKPIEIIGDGKRDDIVIQSRNEDAVLFEANNGRVANLTLRPTGRGVFHGVNIMQGRLHLEDCDISSQSLACVAIHSGANPTLRRCCIRNGKAAGVFVYENGQGTLEDNEIFVNAKAGVEIMEGGNLTMRRNRISLNGDVGIWVHMGGGGIFENNDLRGNTKGAWDIAPDSAALMQRTGNIE